MRHEEPSTAEDRFRDVARHIRWYFDGHSIELQNWDEQHVLERLGHLAIVKVQPGPRIDLWTYVSIGASSVFHEGHGNEFCVIAREPSPEHCLLIAMTAYYHAREHLGIGHTVPIGGPWTPGSVLTHTLISRPYPFGPELEMCEVAGGHVQILWELPISEAEKEFAVRNGWEALEQRFEDVRLEYWNPLRRSVV